LLFADGAGGLDGVGALVAELGHGFTGHQLERALVIVETVDILSNELVPS
jgi:hypothetical protein